jgi:hypothetical protein
MDNVITEIVHSFKINRNEGAMIIDVVLQPALRLDFVGIAITPPLSASMCTSFHDRVSIPRSFLCACRLPRLRR